MCIRDSPKTPYHSCCTNTNKLTTILPTDPITIMENTPSANDPSSLHVNPDPAERNEPKKKPLRKGNVEWLFDMVEPEKPYVIVPILLYRCFISLYVRSFYAPDEYYQSVEVAHRIVFGYGYTSWEWTIEEPIRSIVHPFIFAILYKVLALLSLDTGFLIAYAPRLLQAVLLTITDYYVYWIAEDAFKDAYTAKLSMLLHLAAWFTNFTMVRTLSNSFESILIVIAYYYWSRTSREYSRTDTIAGALYALCFIVRPTSAMVFLVLVFIQLVKYRLSAIKNLLGAFFFGAVPMLLICFAIDYWFYKELVFAPLNFLKVNVLANISSYYGTQELFYYLRQALPNIFLGYGVLIIPGILISPCHSFLLAALAYFCLMSYLPHKEDRFVLPVVSFLLVSAGRALAALFRRLETVAVILLVLTVGHQVNKLVEVNTVANVAPLDTMDFLRTISPKHLKSVYMLMPCHTTPFYSHLHRDIVMRFPTCPPPLPDRSYRTQQSKMLQDIGGFLDNVLEKRSYSHIVTTNYFEEVIGEQLESYGYEKIKEIFSSEHEKIIGGRVMKVTFCIYWKQ
eukprot:TRINITY_DN7298_c0_g1_i4.p1 TRINITY_DN7298_c0_g1~~TRINITY_DN7298_c0_g1_i4.p1  ORF type:complete len:566 (+),score=82.68 TRINITY_DN7298_c0_g1_i4:3-1700(+)